MVSGVVREIQAELQSRANAARARRHQEWWERLYGESTATYGVPAPVVRQLSAAFFPAVKTEAKSAVFQVCEALLAAGSSEEQTIAFDWAFRLRRRYEPADFAVLQRWLTRYVHGWGAVDDLCTHALGAFLYQFPACIPQTRPWAQRRNRWLRRASAVCLIYGIRRRQGLADALAAAEAVLTDADVMVQKGYGWLLKEASRAYPREVYAFVLARRGTMPRTALRYAIEKLPPALRREAMARPDGPGGGQSRASG
jgi:3-methyladenine DNA glycosylase AlkD